MTDAEQERFDRELLVLRLAAARMRDPRDGGVSRRTISEALRFVQSTQGGLLSIASSWEKADRSRTWTDPLELAQAAVLPWPPSQTEATLQALQQPLVGSELDAAQIALQELLLAGSKRRLAQVLDDSDSLPEALERIRKEGGRLRKDEIPSLQELLDEGISKDTSTDRSGFQVRSELVTSTGAAWWNNWAGPSARFTAGSTMLIGGASSSGKTTLSNILAISALEQGLPVFFYQAELAPWRHLKDLLLLHFRRDRRKRLASSDVLPENWVWQQGREKEDLLRYPPLGSEIRQKNVMLSTLEAWADNWERRLSDSPNACKGVVILDYIQLIRDDTARSDYTALESIASELAQFAASRSLVLILLSQVSKGDQKEIGRALADAMVPPKDGRSSRSEEVRKVLEANAETFFAGADIRRVADMAAAVVPIPGSEDSSGNRLRALVLSKERGHAWSIYEEGGKKVLSFRLGVTGTFQDVAYGVSGLPDVDAYLKPTTNPTPARQGRGVPATEEEVP
jgi:hypothetical protein